MRVGPAQLSGIGLGAPLWLAIVLRPRRFVHEAMTSPRLTAAQVAEICPLDRLQAEDRKT
jgi:hypothetical protein